MRLKVVSHNLTLFVVVIGYIKQYSVLLRHICQTILSQKGKATEKTGLVREKD